MPASDPCIWPVFRALPGASHSLSAGGFRGAHCQRLPGLWQSALSPDLMARLWVTQPGGQRVCVPKYGLDSASQMPQLLTAFCLVLCFSPEARGLPGSAGSSRLTMSSVRCVGCPVRGCALVGPQPGVGVLPSVLLMVHGDLSSWSHLPHGTARWVPEQPLPRQGEFKERSHPRMVGRSGP